MKVKVELYTILREYGKGKISRDKTVSLPELETLQALSSYLEIPDRLGKVFLVNGTPREKEYVLREGDEVKVLPFIGGG